VNAGSSRRSSTTSNASVCASALREKSMAPAASQAFTQARWPVQRARSIW
jgi:hypothetical protein